MYKTFNHQKSSKPKHSFTSSGIKSSQSDKSHHHSQKTDSDIIIGIHATQSLLSSDPERINHIIFVQDSQNSRLFKLQKIAKKNKIKTHQLPQKKLDYYSEDKHQGVITFCNARTLDNWGIVKEILFSQAKQKQAPQIVLLSNIEDPRNLGACLRSCLALGIETVLLPTKGTCGLTGTAAKASAGASEILTIVRVHDLETTLQELQKNDFLVYGIEKEGVKNISDSIFEEKPTVFILGGEDKGISPHIKRNCNDILSIPMSKNAHSYNASIALSLFLYEAQRQRNFKQLEKLK